MNNFKLKKSYILKTNYPKTEWKKSSFCGNSACVEVAKLGEKYAVRDSKNIKLNTLLFTKEEWNAFILGVKNGEFE